MPNRQRQISARTTKVERPQRVESQNEQFRALRSSTGLYTSKSVELRPQHGAPRTSVLISLVNTGASPRNSGGAPSGLYAWPLKMVDRRSRSRLWIVFKSGGMYRAMFTNAECSGSLSPHANISSSWSCRSFVRFGPTAVASMPMHWKIGSSEGAFFFLLVV